MGMPRANRYYLPKCVWQLTHRCHKREFLLEFGRERNRWVSWLFEARKRFGLSILNCAVTSNHIHLPVFAGAVGSVSYATEVQSRLGIPVRKRSVEESGTDGVYLLREEDAPYMPHYDPENGILSAQNALSWKLTG